MSSPYAVYGPRLVEKGFCAVPCMPGDKVPADFVAGEWKPMSSWTTKYLVNLPSSWQVKSWASKPDGGVCLLTGRASQYVVAIDVDVDDAVEDVFRALGHTDVSKRGQKGATFFYRSKTIPSSAFNGTTPGGRVVRLVDILADDRQTVLPPSIHPKTGEPYRWTGKYALDEIEPEDLPELPENALEILKNVLRDHGYNEDTMPHSHALNAAARAGDPRFKNFDASGVYSMLNQDAWQNVDKWIDRLGLFKLQRTRNGYVAVANFRDSGTGNALEDRKQNLKIDLRKPSIVDFGENGKGYSPINLVAACRKLTRDDAYRYLSELVYGLIPDETFSGLKPSQRETPAHADEPNEEPAAAKTREYMMDVTQAPGLLGAIATHVTLSATKQQPLFSMGAALAIISVLAGRQYRGPTELGTALYQVIAAPSGAGKQLPMDAIEAVLKKCGLSDLLGPTEFASDVAIFSAVMRKPNMVICIDECAGLMGRGSSRNAASHEVGIPSVLRIIYNKCFKTYKTKESAARKSEDIHWPNLSIFGASTADELYARLTSLEVKNGLLNRFIILRNDIEPDVVQNQFSIWDVPADIVEGCKRIYYRDNVIEGGPFHGDGSTEPTAPIIDIPFANEEAKQIWADIQRLGTKKTRDKSELYVRCAENAMRVATIRAISNDWRQPAITADDLMWAAAYTFKSADSMEEDTTDKIAGSLFEEETNKVVGFLKKAGGEVTRARLMRAVKMSRSRLDEVLNTLIEAGRVKQTAVDGQLSNRVYKMLV